MPSLEARWSCFTLYERLDWREESWGSDIVNWLVFHYHLYNLTFKLILLRFNGVLSLQSGYFNQATVSQTHFSVSP